MKKILFILLTIPTTLKAQSFSDYKEWVLTHPDFFVKSMVTDTAMGIREDSTYSCHIIKNNNDWIFIHIVKLEDDYFWVVISDHVKLKHSLFIADQLDGLIELLKDIDLILMSN